MTAATALALDAADHQALQGPTDPVKARSDHLQLVSQSALHSSHPEDAMERTPMSCQSSSDFLECFKRAISRRVGTGRGIQAKQLAYVMQVSESTVWSWLAGNNPPRADHLLRLITFFDESFANEILAPTGCTVAKFSDRRAAALKKITEGMQELKAMEA